MAASGDVDTKELELIIKGLLISSPTVRTANILERECQEELGKTFPYRKLGFASFVDYLRSIPTVVKLQPPNGYNPNVLPVTSKASSHIDQLVSKQRVAPSKKRGTSRRGAYNSRPTPLRRRPTNPPSNNYSAPPAFRPNQGINVRDLDDHMRRNYDERDLTRNGIHSVDDLLSHADHMVERDDTKVYPKLTRDSNYSNGNNRLNVMPAGYEDDFDDDDDFYDEYEGKDSEEEMSNQVIEMFSHKFGVEGDMSSSRSEPPQRNTPTVAQEEERFHYQNQEFPQDDINISEGMINNFRRILSDHPDGIWVSQLQPLYQDYFGASLDVLDLGHPSAISLASSLPSVFTYSREGLHDWKLYDARIVSQESLDGQENGAATLSQEKERFIPQTIIENIKSLLEKHNNGFRSTDLLSLYSSTFNKPLSLDILGFDNLEEFLMILKNDVTLKKAFNYYLLLPKHKLMSHEALLPPKPDNQLNVLPESLGVPIPDGVMKLGDEILLQELPPLTMDPNSKAPLLELEVRVAEVMSPVFFYMSLDKMFEELEKMMDNLDKYYRWEEANLKIPLPHIARNLYCTAKYDGYWHRVKITRIKDHSTVEVEYIDYGTPSTLKTTELRYLSKEFAYLPAQAFCSKLVGIKPLDGATRFPEPVCAKFLSLVLGKRLVAHVYNFEEKVRYRQERVQMEVVLYDVEPNREIVINDHLVEIGMALPLDSITVAPTKTEPTQPQVTEDQLLDLISPLASSQTSAVPATLPSSTTSPLGNIAPSFDNIPASLPTISGTHEDNKHFRPPPGFKEITSLPAQCNFNLSMPVDDSVPMKPNTNQSNNPYNVQLTEEQKLLIQDFLAHNPSLLPKLIQEQMREQNMCQANPTNLPFHDAPLYENNSPQSFTYGSVVPPPGYVQLNPVPMIPPGFFLMNAPVPNPYFPMYPQTNFVAPAPGNFQGFGQGFMIGQPLQHALYKHSHSPHSFNYPMSSTNYKPTSAGPRLGSCPPSASPSPTNSEPIRTNQIPRPATPLTPASKEVANICEMDRTQSSQSDSAIWSANSQKSMSPEEILSNSQINTGIKNTLIETQNDRNLVDNTSASDTSLHPQLCVNEIPLPPQIDVDKIPLPEDHETIIQDLNSHIDLLDIPENSQPNTKVNKVPADYENVVKDLNSLLNVTRRTSPNIKVNEMPFRSHSSSARNSQHYSSSENLFSAVSSPTDPLVRLSSLKGELSDDYASAAEYLDEDQLANLTMTGHISESAAIPESDDIPDSWENLDLDDTPAMAANFTMDLSKPLDLIINDINEEKSFTDGSAQKSVSEIRGGELNIDIPVNWKEMFNPDSTSLLERIDNNNTVKITPDCPPKFNVKNVPVQVVECQSKPFHLLQVKGVPAVVVLEFFKQFSATNPSVSEKVVELSTKHMMYYINMADYPIISSELNKVTMFWGSLPKKAVIRLNKVRVLNLSDIPQCLKVLNVANQPLVEDLKRIADELASC